MWFEHLKLNNPNNVLQHDHLSSITVMTTGKKKLWLVFYQKQKEKKCTIMKRGIGN